MRRPIVAVVLAGVALAGVALASTRLGGGAEDDSAHVRVAREDFRESVEAQGHLEAAVAFEIGPPSVEGVWDYALVWMVPEGRRVQAGEVVARFDATAMEDQLRAHRAQLETTLQEKEREERNLQVNVEQLRLDIVKAEGELARVDVSVALPEGMVSNLEMEELRLSRELHARRVAFLREKIAFQRQLVRGKLELLDVKRRFAEGKIAYAEDARAKFDVKAPVGGMVLYVPKRNGERWEVGESVWMLAKLLKIADVATLRVEADVLEVDSARLAPGQPASIAVDAIPGLRFETNVEKIGSIVHERSGQDRTKVFDAYLPLGANPPEALRPGMSVSVEIETARHAGALTLPLAAVRVTDEGPCVLVRGEGGGDELRSVKLGARGGGRVIVLDGLAEGDLVRAAAKGVKGGSA